jgi:putative redox protein
MTKIVTKWKGVHEFSSEMGHNTINIDGSRENGFGPKALLLSGLAGCSGIDVVDILQKMRVEFSVFEIEVEADQTDEHPKVYKDINIT